MKHKVTAFTMAPISAGPFGGKAGKTVRLVIPINIVGEELIFRFSNREGMKTAVMDCATVALCDELGIIYSETIHRLTFCGKTVLTMAPGAEAECDPVKISVHPGMYLALSLYCRKRPVCTSSLGKHAFASEKNGNFCYDNFKAGSRKSLMERFVGLPIDASIPYFRALDIMTGASPVVISCLGDSITMQCQWYTPLLKRLYREHPGECCLLNAGISGNRLMNDTPPMHLGAAAANMFGSAGFKRLEWDTLADYGVTHCLIALGVNDIVNADPKGGRYGLPEPPIFLDVCKQMTSKLHAAGIFSLAMTIYPANMKDIQKEQRRKECNNIIKSGVFDDVFDIENILCAEAGHGYRAGYAYSDGLHLNETGGATLANRLNFANCFDMA